MSRQPVWIQLLSIIDARARRGVLDRGALFSFVHQLEEVEKIVEYAGFIDRGKLLMEARLDDIKNEFRLMSQLVTLFQHKRLASFVR